MLELGAVPGGKKVVCERIVRAVPGDEGPHEIYDALTRMAKDFVMRHPLVDGWGNFGSIDGDPPADAEYTEARLAPLAVELLCGAPVPDLLINGGDGVLPHNLREVAAGAIAFLEDPTIEGECLRAHVPGPDFPTAGLVVDAGPDRVLVRARTHFEGDKIVVTELPYRVEKGGDDGVIRAIAELANERRLALRDLLDESDRAGMRIVIVPEGDPHGVLTALLEQTALEISLTVKHSLRDLLERFVREQRPRPAQLRALAERFGDERRTALPGWQSSSGEG